MVRLVDHLKSLGMGNREAREALATGKVWLRGCPVADPGRVVDPAEVDVRPSAPRVVMGRDPLVLLRDPGFVVVWKPSGMLAVPAPHRHDPSVLGFVRRQFGKSFPVHRLDEGTSGLMIVALREDVQEALKSLLERHLVERRYLAIVRGSLREPLTVRNTLVRDRGDGKRGSGIGGKPAVTHFAPVEALNGATLVEAQLETGRTHQVRIHLAELGHPVLGDDLYGDGRGGRLALHAWRLAFNHPGSNKPIALEAPLADDLEELRRKLARA